MTVTYLVKFKLYHYNSGDGRNGMYTHQESFKELKDAQDFAAKVKGMAVDRRPYGKELTEEESRETSEFAHQYCWDGFVQSYIGTYKVTEELL